VFFEAMEKTDFAEPIPVSQKKQKSDLKMKSERQRSTWGVVGPLGIYSVTKWKRRARSALILTL
jgi:hypothetical protein